MLQYYFFFFFFFDYRIVFTNRIFHYIEYKIVETILEILLQFT